MGTGSALAGKEVPVVGSDAVRWIDLHVHSSSNNVAVNGDDAPATTYDRASCFVVGDPPTYLIWRIHKALPHSLELLELAASKEFPRVGLRFTFPDVLCPFAFICKNEISGASRFPYLLYVLTVSGVGYLLRIRNISAYASISIVPVDELLEVNVRGYIANQAAAIAAVTATAGGLVVGTSDGSVFCFQLGVLDPSAPGFVHELRDEAGITRLWGLIPRGKMVGTVQELVILELHEKKFVFVLHLDGTLRIWDLASHSRVFSHNMGTMTMAGATFVRLWVGQSYPDMGIIPLAILFRDTLDENLETISLCSILYKIGDKIVFSMESSVQNIPLEEGRCLDVKLTLEKIWILKDDELVSHTFSTNTDEVEAFSYALQEEFVADQLFQSSEHHADEILQITHSIFSSSKDDILPFVSCVFLRRLLLPGVHHNATLYATLVEYSRHLSESELQTLTADGIKKEILSIIEHEVGSEKVSLLHCWKSFFNRYFHNWCKSNALYGLLVDSSSDAVGLIRRSSISLFRSLEDIERIMEGSSDDVSELTCIMDISDDDLECEILIELVRCVMSFSQQLGKTASSIFYESLLTTPVIASEDIIRYVVKILETGYCMSGPVFQTSTSGNHIVVLEKELADHKSLRKLSADMFLSLQSLYKKASAWGRILNVIECFLKFLVPKKVIQNFNTEVSSSINSSVVVHTTYQIAKVMFESAWDFLLFLSYLVDISGQVHLTHDDINKVQLELVPMLQEIIFEWLIIIFFTITPSSLAVTEDFNSKLSSLQIDNNMGKRLLNVNLGRCDFTLAFIFLLNVGSSSLNHSHFSSDCFSNAQSFINRARDFINWIIWGRRDTRINEPHASSQNHETGEAEVEQPVYRHSPTELPCGHIFGRDCIFRWTQEHNSCPICRARIVENDGLNHAVHDTPVGMDEFDRQSFERIRQLIYGESATNANGGTDGGITLQRHNVIVIRPDSAIFGGNAERPNNEGEASASPTNNDIPSTSGQDTSRGETGAQTGVPQQRHLPDGVEALGVIPLALFSLAPSGIRREAEPRNNPTEANPEGGVTAGAGTSTTPASGNNTGSSSLPMNSNDINRLFDLIANLTDRIQPRRSENNSATDTTLSGQETGALNGARQDDNGGTGSTQTGGSRFRLFDFLGRRRRLRNLAQNGTANTENTNNTIDTNTRNGRGDNTPANSSSPTRADGLRGAFSEVERNLLGGSRNLFSTGVASFRDSNGVTTVDITGDMPPRASSASTSSESSNDNNESPNN